MPGFSLLLAVLLSARCIFVCDSQASVHAAAIMRRETEVAQESKTQAAARELHLKQMDDDQVSDGQSNSTAYKLAPPSVRSAHSPLLLFWSVSANHRVQDLVKKNVHRAKSSLKEADVFLAHYDLKKSEWLDRDKAWYEKNVAFSAERKGLKLNLARELLLQGNIVNMNDYRWIWTLDEDVDFLGVDLARLFGIAEYSKALIVMPAFEQPQGGRAVVYEVQRPDPTCQYRYVSFLEMIFPIFQAHVLKLFLSECDHCLHDTSAWGSDKTWCHWSARRTKTDRDTACAIIDETPVFHKDFKTIHKYHRANPQEAMNFTWLQQAQADLVDVQEHHPDDFVAKAQIKKTMHCVQQRSIP